MGFLTPNGQGEQDVLATFVIQQLSQVRAAVHGLTDEQIRSTPTPSSLSLAWLGLHCAAVARVWGVMVVEGRAPESDQQGAGDGGLTDDTTAAEVETALAEAATWLEERLRGDVDLAAPVEVPDAPWYPPELTSWETRWLYAHLIAELARHAGHADIIRESIDGKGSYELNDLLEGKEPVDGQAAGGGDAGTAG